YSLVTPDAQTLVDQYAIPVAYQPNKNFNPEGHLAFRLIRSDQCKGLTRDWGLPLFPNAAIGCGLISGGTPAWNSFTNLIRSHIAIDTVPDGVDHEKYELPESVMLGIPKYTAADLADFRGFRQNDEALPRIAEEPKRVEDDSFA